LCDTDRIDAAVDLRPGTGLAGTPLGTFGPGGGEIGEDAWPRFQTCWHAAANTVATYLSAGRILRSMRPLTTDMTRQDLRPYFLWDEDVSIGELQQILAGPDSPRRDQLLGKMLREARDLDVWQFVRPVEVAGALERLRRRLGRRYAFWSFLIDGWRRHGLLGT
jgi:hypothetical protein